MTSKRSERPFPTREEVLAFIRESKGPVGKREIARAFLIRGAERPALKELLKELRRSGDLQAGAKRAVTENRAEILAPEIKRLQVQVKLAEGEVEKFRSGADLLLGANNIPLAQQQLAELNTQLSTARSARSLTSASSTAPTMIAAPTT